MSGLCKELSTFRASFESGSQHQSKIRQTVPPSQAQYWGLQECGIRFRGISVFRKMARTSGSGLMNRTQDYRSAVVSSDFFEVNRVLILSQ